MDYDKERPAKRVRLEQTSPFETQSVSPIRTGTQDQNFKYSVQNFLLNHERQPEYPAFSAPSEADERPSCLQDEQLEGKRTSPVYSHAICSEKSEFFTDSADLVCFGSVGPLP